MDLYDRFVWMVCKAQPMMCVGCEGLDPLGLPIHEMIGHLKVQTGVLCQHCQDSFVPFKMLNAESD